MNRIARLAVVSIFIVLLSGCSFNSSSENISENDESEPLIVIGEAGDIENGNIIDVKLPDNADRAAETKAAEEKEAEKEIENAENEKSETAGIEAEESEETEAAENLTEKKLLQYIGEASQIITVEASLSSAVVTLYDRLPDDTFEQVLSTNASIGKNGIGKEREGDCKTPSGVYHFTMAFGSMVDPGSLIPYTQVDERHIWVDDPSSALYNRFVDTTQAVKDWNSAEKLCLSSSSYNYALALDYNSACIPGKGSAIFMHCLPTKGFGCIAIPQEVMKQLLTLVKPDCVIAIY